MLSMWLRLSLIPLGGREPRPAGSFRDDDLITGAAEIVEGEKLNCATLEEHD